MNAFFLALNRPAGALRQSRLSAWLPPVLATILINSVFEPLLSYFCGEGARTLSLLHMLRLTFLGAAAYPLICAALWIICRAFGSGAGFSRHLTGWGITFFPNVLCAVAVAVSEVFFYVFWNSSVWGAVLSFVFLGILFWKLLLFYIYLRELAQLRGLRLLGALAVSCVLILGLAALEGYLGIKTPII